MITSPWKRGEYVDSTSLIEGDLSGIFWQRPKNTESSSSLRQISADRKLKEMPNRGFDVNKMLCTSSARQGGISTATKAEPCQGLEVTKEGDDEQHFLDKDGAETNDHDHKIEDEEDLESAPKSEAQSDDEEEPCATLDSPRTIKVPVRFNDTTELSFQSEAQYNENTDFESPPCSPCRPVTPRSAMKGSRASLSLVDDSASPTPRKVVFSRRSSCLDESGIETSMRVRDGSLSPDSSFANGEVQDAKVKPPGIKTRQDANGPEENQEHDRGSAVAAKQAPAVSWFSRLTGWGSKHAAAACPAPARASGEAKQQQPQSDSKRALSKENIAWEPTTTALPTTNLHISKPRPLAPSDVSSSRSSSDPRIPPSPETLPVSGYFSDNHYKHLHILYLKSLTSSFTCPGSLRPELKKYIGHKVYSGDGEFAWEVTRRDAEVVERWIRSFEGIDARERVEYWEDGMRGKGRYRVVSWDEWDLCKRLYSIVAGQEIRREERERERKEGGLKKGVLCT